MSTIKTVDIGCDWPDCDAIAENQNFEQTARAARASAYAQFWGVRKLRSGARVDLCPTHLRLVHDNPDALHDAFGEATPTEAHDGE